MDGTETFYKNVNWTRFCAWFVWRKTVSFQIPFFCFLPSLASGLSFFWIIFRLLAEEAT